MCSKKYVKLHSGVQDTAGKYQGPVCNKHIPLNCQIDAHVDTSSFRLYWPHYCHSTGNDFETSGVKLVSTNQPNRIQSGFLVDMFVTTASSDLTDLVLIQQDHCHCHYFKVFKGHQKSIFTWFLGSNFDVKM